MLWSNREYRLRHEVENRRCGTEIVALGRKMKQISLRWFGYIGRMSEDRSESTQE